MHEIFDELMRSAAELKQTGLHHSEYVRLPDVRIALPHGERVPPYNAEIVAECRGCGRLCRCEGMIEADGTILPYDTGGHHPPLTPKCGDKVPFAMIAYRRIVAERPRARTQF